MYSGSISLAAATIIPKEGAFKPNGPRFSVEIMCSNLSAASAEMTLQGSISREGFGTVYDGTEAVTETLTSGVRCFRSFDVDPDCYYNISFPGSLTGTVNYWIEE